MSAQADTNCHDIFNVVSATRTHLAKIGATCHVVSTCHDMSATFPAKQHGLEAMMEGSRGVAQMGGDDVRQSYVRTYAHDTTYTI